LVPVLGILWTNLINERFQIKKVKSITNQQNGDTDMLRDKVRRVLKVKFSPRHGKKKMEFVIETSGLVGLYAPKS
jgi:hypothetical protein